MAVLNLGVDVGNGNTKFLDQIFESRVDDSMLLKGFGKKKEHVHEVEYNGETYLVGQGNAFMSKDRYTCRNYQICLLTAIALAAQSMDSIAIDANVCIGIPIFMYVNDKDLVHEIESFYNSKAMNLHQIVVDGIKKFISLKHVYVFSENAEPIMHEDDMNQILIDIGEGTVNISQWENQIPLKIATKDKEDSFISLYNKMADKLKSKLNKSVNVRDIIKFIGQDEITLYGDKYDFRFSKDMLENHVRNLASNISNTFNVSTAKKIRLLGGGAVPTEKYWKRVLDNVEVISNNQFVNAQMYQLYAELKEKQRQTIDR